MFKDKVAIVTGGASGIGLALGTELVQRGAKVVLADLNGDGAAAAARRLPAGAARGARVDVTDAAAVDRVVRDVAAEHGRVDYLFNNAGIFICGDASRMTLADWGRIVDVNIRGVVHGVATAYPLMIRQGFGHIVNTASAAGLSAVPGASAYAMTKHAVVGLSTSLRGEAARHGVRISVVCPGPIDTPIKDAATYLDIDRDAVLKSVPKLYPLDPCARAILRGVERNRALIVVTPFARVGWALYRLSPRLMIRLAQAFAERSPLLARKR